MQLSRVFTFTNFYTCLCSPFFDVCRHLQNIFKNKRFASTPYTFWNPELLLFNLHTKIVVLRAWELTFRKSGAPASARCTFLEDWFPGFQPFIFQRNRKIAPDGPTPPKSLAYIIILGRFSIDFARLLSRHGLTYITNLTHLQTHSPT